MGEGSKGTERGEEVVAVAEEEVVVEPAAVAFASAAAAVKAKRIALVASERGDVCRKGLGPDGETD